VFKGGGKIPRKGKKLRKLRGKSGTQKKEHTAPKGGGGSGQNFIVLGRVGRKEDIK